MGKLKFTDEQLDATNKSLEESGVPMPQFSNIESALAKELPEDVRDRFLKENEDKIIKSQAAVRSFLARKLFKQQQDRIRRLIVAQAQIRMHMARSKHLAKLKHYKDNEGKVIVVQAHWRGHVVRKAYKERKDYYRANMDSIVKIQAMWKARHAEKAYKSIASLNNPSLGVLQEFLHLLDDSDTDFEEELELERLRQLVVKRIRDNILEDSDVNDLDVKISLLVKNRISLEEVVKSTSGNRKKKQATTESNDPFSLRGRDKETKAKLEYYGQLFYLLQTQPEYLAKLMFSMNSKSAGNVTKTLENIILALYGYAQNTREEYLFLNLIKVNNY